MSNKPINTWSKHITFALINPVHQNAEVDRLVRTLTVSETIFVPENYPEPTSDQLGFVSFDYRDDADMPKIHELIRREVVRSKSDGLPLSVQREIERQVADSTIEILNTSSSRKTCQMAGRYVIKVVIAGKQAGWLDPANKTMPLLHHEGVEWAGTGTPEFYDKRMYVSKLVAAQHAKQVLDDPAHYGITEQPESATVQEVCYGIQTIHLSTDRSVDKVHGTSATFPRYTVLEFA